MTLMIGFLNVRHLDNLLAAAARLSSAASFRRFSKSAPVKPTVDLGNLAVKLTSEETGLFLAWTWSVQPRAP